MYIFQCFISLDDDIASNNFVLGICIILQYHLGWDAREGLFSLFRIDCYQSCWLWLHTQINCIHSSTASREFAVESVITSACSMLCLK